MKPIFGFSSAKNSKDVCAWLNSLPVHDNYRYAEAVKKALYAYNAMELDDIERVRVLECFAPHVKTIATELNRNRVGVALPVTPKRQKVVNLIVSLHRGMADACLGMIHRETTSELGNQQSDRVLVSEIILNAIQHLTHILHLCYQTYQTEPGKIWTELHAVFLFALENDLVDLRKARKVTDGSPGNAIVHAYKQVVLLGLSDPYHLPFGTVDSVVKALDGWQALVQLSEKPRPSKRDCQFIIDLNADFPAMPLLPHSHVEKYRKALIIDTGDLTSLLNHKLEGYLTRIIRQMKEVSHLSLIDTMEMYRALIIHWGVQPIRTDQRKQLTAKSCVSITGIGSINYTLNDNRDFFQSESDYELADPMLTTNSLFKGTFGQQMQQGAVSTLEKISWTVLDQSDGGLRIVLDKNRHVQVSVGELMAINLDNDESGWLVGIIRWAKFDQHDNSLELGIRILGESAKPASIIHVEMEDGDELPNEPELAICFLPEYSGDESKKTMQTIVTKRGVYSPGSQFCVQVDGADHIVIACNLIASTRYVDWFEIDRQTQQPIINTSALMTEDDDAESDPEFEVVGGVSS